MDKELDDFTAENKYLENNLSNENEKSLPPKENTKKQENPEEKDSLFNGYNVASIAGLLALSNEEIELMRASIDGK